MRILLIPARYFPHKGGLENVTGQLVNGLQDMGHDVHVVTNRYPRSLPRTEIVGGSPVTRMLFLYPRLEYLPQKRFDLFFGGFVFFWITLVKLFWIILRLRPDVVNIHYVGSASLFILLIGSVLPFRLVTSLHGGDVVTEAQRSAFDRWLFRRITKRSEKVTACSGALLQRATQLSPSIKQSCVVHNGVNTALFSNAIAHRPERAYFFGVGQLAHHKGFDILIDAFASVATHMPEMDLIIAGNGSDKSILQNKIENYHLSDRINLIGYLESSKVALMMKSSAAVIVPSRLEAFGIVALEALATGSCVIASKTAGLLEALEPYDTVKWFEIEDIEGLAAALELRYQERNTPNPSGIPVRDWKVVVEDYLKVLI